MIDLNLYKTQLNQGDTDIVTKQTALADAIALGLPNTRMENWRYTNLKPVLEQCFNPVHSDKKLSKASLPEKTTTWPRLVFYNGQMISELSEPIPTGLSITNNVLDNARFEDPDQVFECLNLALKNGGFDLEVTEGSKAELEILFMFDGQADQASHLRNNILVAKGAELSVLMTYCDKVSKLGWLNASNNTTIEAGAKLVHYSDISAPNADFLNIRDFATLNGGRYENHSLLTDCPSARHEVSFVTKAEGSQALLSGAFLGSNKQTLDTITRASHLVPNCHSEQFFKGIVAGGGKTAFQGKVFVEQDAQKTVANQSCKNIILDNGAEANIKPELLIYADDVKCAHGTTVGELDENALFYLEQRGITPKESKAILVNAFLEEIVDLVPAVEIQSCFRVKITRWMSEN